MKNNMNIAIHERNSKFRINSVSLISVTLMAMDPNCVALSGESFDRKDPIGVLTALKIKTSDDFLKGDEELKVLLSGKHPIIFRDVSRHSCILQDNGFKNY